MRRHLLRAAVSAALLTTVAAAQPAELGGTRGHWPTEITRRPLTLAQGMIEVAAPVQLNASKDADWKPVTLNPSVTLGLTDQWMIGARTFVGLCLGGADNGCPHVFNDLSAFTRVSFLRAHGTEFALQVAVNGAPITDPSVWSADAGLALRFGGGALAVTIQPTVSFGLNDRDTRASRTTAVPWNFGTYDVYTPFGTIGNKEHLSIPATLQLQLGPTLALAAGISLEGPINPDVGDFGDYYQIPVGFAAIVTPIPNLDIGASFTFPRMAGNADTRDIRQLAAFVAFRI